jgi:hypothetical protein
MSDETKTAYAKLADVMKDFPELQGDLDSMIQTRLDRDRKLRGSAEDKAVALEAENKQLWEKLNEADKTAAALKKVQAEIDGAKQDAQSWQKKHVGLLAQTELRKQAAALGVRPGAVDMFIKATLADAEASLDATGKLNITIGGKPLDETALKALATPDICNPDTLGGAGSGGAALGLGGVGSGGINSAMAKIAAGKAGTLTAEEIKAAHSGIKQDFGIQSSPFDFGKRAVVKKE